MPLSSGLGLLCLYPALRTLSRGTILVVAMSSTRGWGCALSPDSPIIWGRMYLSGIQLRLPQFICT